MIDGDKLFKAKLEDMVSASREGKTRFSSFISESERAKAEDILSEADGFVGFWGGNEKAVRCMASVSSYELQKDDYPITAVKVTAKDVCTLSHRDFLGAVLSLGIERDAIGDIVIDESSDAVWLFATDSAAKLILSELKTVGRLSVKTAETDGGKIILPDKKFEDISVSVSSKRADAVIAAVCRISREDACEIIDSGFAVSDGKVITKHEKELDVGNVFSVRGHGKFAVDYAEIRGKKGKYTFLIKKYI